MRIPVGRIIRTDMGDDRWGKVVYLVINPPIVCETCDSVVFEWRSDNVDVICPDCGNVIHDRFYYPCPVCGGDDYHSLRVVHNNNWCYDSVTGEVIDYCDKRGKVLNMCGKSLINDFKYNKIWLLTARESQDLKRKILWTHLMDYDPLKPMPQWIIDKFPYDKQE